MKFWLWQDVNSGNVLTVSAGPMVGDPPVPSGYSNDGSVEVSPLQLYPAVVTHGDDYVGRNQMWAPIFGPDGTTYKLFRSRQSGLVIDAQGGNPVDGAPLQIYPRNDGDNQHWQLYPPSVPGMNDTHRVTYDNTQDSNGEGGKVWSWWSGGLPWTPIDGTPVAPAVVIYTAGQNRMSQLWRNIESRDYSAWIIQSALVPPFGNSLVLDVPGYFQLPTVVQQYGFKGGITTGETNQAWELIDAGGNFYTIKSLCSDLVLTFDPEKVGNFAYLTQQQDNQADSQLWMIPNFDPGAFINQHNLSIIPKAGNGQFRLDVVDSVMEQGQYVQVFPDNAPGNGGMPMPNQLWNLVNYDLLL